MEENQTEVQSEYRGGVRTAAGKAISRYNAEKHSILRESMTEYETIKVEDLYNDLSDSLNPSDRMQESLVEMICSDLVKCQRIEKAESELVKSALHPQFQRLDMGGYSPKITASDMEKLMLYSRYKTANQNRLFRTLAVLKQLQKYEQDQE